VRGTDGSAWQIIASYEVSVDGRRNSVSLMTVELNETPGGTQLRLTEQGAFLDGLDSNAQREDGARDSLDKPDTYLIGAESS
jgi:hypothetical protein